VAHAAAARALSTKRFPRARLARCSEAFFYFPRTGLVVRTSTTSVRSVSGVQIVPIASNHYCELYIIDRSICSRYNIRDERAFLTQTATAARKGLKSASDNRSEIRIRTCAVCLKSPRTKSNKNTDLKINELSYISPLHRTLAA